MSWFRETSEGAFLSTKAVVVGDVQLAAESSVWFDVVIRGDVAPVVIGKRVNVQDGSVIHCDSGYPNTIEDDVSIGHRAVVHGERVGRGTLVGIGAIVLGRTNIGEECLVAAGAVVPPGMTIPDRTLVMGVPARIARPVSDKELEYMRWVSSRYVDLVRKYQAGAFGSPGNDR